MNRKKRRAVLRSLQKKGLAQVDEHGIWTQTAKVREAIAEADAEFDALYGSGEAKRLDAVEPDYTTHELLLDLQKKGLVQVDEHGVWTQTAAAREAVAKGGEAREALVELVVRDDDEPLQ
jgi:hypothetical protein